ncbi:hypothetical protein DPMN_039860 [Dreissena polymorpha]|uniref:Uncharacterized protein n=1 Tax=Dreissena polymorpha TaxID=45954 RepID=A0A9D4HUS0_DREPO|nr:hypothetical protein DPMN_039860 [Dreissena polymorpha]
MSETFGKTLTCSSRKEVDSADDLAGVIFKGGLRIDVWGKGNSGRNGRRSEDVCIVDCKADSFRSQQIQAGKVTRHNGRVWRHVIIRLQGGLCCRASAVQGGSRQGTCCTAWCKRRLRQWKACSYNRTKSFCSSMNHRRGHGKRGVKSAR